MARLDFGTSSEDRRAHLPASLALRLRITATAFALVALVLMLFVAPANVTVPLAFAFGAGAVASAIIALIDRRAHDVAEAAPRRESRHDTVADAATHAGAPTPAAT